MRAFLIQATSSQPSAISKNVSAQSRFWRGSNMVEEVQSLESVESAALAELEKVANENELTTWRGQYLGSKGVIRSLLSKIGGLAPEERGAYGQAVNALKNSLTEAHDSKEANLQEAALKADLEGGMIDVTLPGRPRPIGRIHPSTKTLRQFYNIWAEMGFQVYR